MRSGRHWRPQFDTSLGVVALGTRADGQKPFQGQLREVRIYGSWLRPVEIEKLARQRNPSAR